jgi:class 3 adenylate cyclase
VLVSVLAIGVWLLTRGYDTNFWPGFIMLLLLIPLGLHAAVVLSAPARAPAAPTPPAQAAGDGERALATVLFTDIVGSTQGRLVKSTGDGILALFDRPGRAIRCATALRDRLRGSGVEIRAGVHTGEVQLRGDDVGGIAVHFAARVMAAAAPGEVLVSGTVHDLVAGSDYVLEDRGAHALKGIAGEWRLFAVRA